MKPPRYTTTITLKGTTHTTFASTHAGIAENINRILGYNAVSKCVVINWLSRKVKSKKYKFIDIQGGAHTAQ
jgi:hypothetical protein